MDIPKSLPEAKKRLAHIIANAQFPVPCMTAAACESLAEQILVALVKERINAADALSQLPSQPEIRDL